MKDMVPAHSGREGPMDKCTHVEAAMETILDLDSLHHVARYDTRCKKVSKASLPQAPYKLLLEGMHPNTEHLVLLATFLSSAATATNPAMAPLT